uniref:Beta-amylase n=2 Tax=Rhizophora mucronata TaxID=61149 RepID=A0A2P2ILY9_RHIMU
MSIASSSTPSFSASFCCKRAGSTPSTRFPFVSFTRRTRPLPRRFVISSRLNSSKSSDAGGPVSPDNGGDFNHYELQHEFAPARLRRRGSPVYVTLPVDAVGEGGLVRRKRTMEQSCKALSAAGVEGVVMEVWWGLVESDRPEVYNWNGYLELVAMARRCRLKVKAVLAFHQCGTGPGDPLWIPLPSWVLEQIDKDPDLAYSDRFGRRNVEYISLGCDVLPVLRGRSPIQAYADFMRNFRDTFKPSLGVTITGVQVGMGPAGELRYPSCPSEKLRWAWHSHELGEFQCYDKYMLSSLNACARETGMREWGYGGPTGAGDLMHDPENTEFFRGNGGSWDTPYGKFFLKWYSGMLLLHGERICREVENIFWGTEVSTSAKLAGIHWHYETQSHPSELTAGYYNTSKRDGYLPFARMFARYRFSLCCTGFELQDLNQKQKNPVSSPEGCLRQLLLAARTCHIPMEGENSAANLDDESFQQVIKMSKFYSGGLGMPAFSFNFMRMGRFMFEQRNWNHFVRFVRQMSGANIFRAKLDLGGDMPVSLVPDAAKISAGFAYC